MGQAEISDAGGKEFPSLARFLESRCNDGDPVHARGGTIFKNVWDGFRWSQDHGMINLLGNIRQGRVRRPSEHFGTARVNHVHRPRKPPPDEVLQIGCSPG